MRRAGDALVLDRFLPYRLSALSNRVSRAIARAYEAAFDLSIPEWRVMAVLGREGGLTASALADATQMDKVAISRAVARLTRSGRLKARAEAGDARRRALFLTPRGLAVYEQIAPLALAYEQQLMTALSQSERHALAALLDKLDHASRALGDIAR
ncbi:MAG: MarR family transcriptional regulator [Alphaproteobacteria bacterium]|nr:MarR family transcriptional regulator [Alphaproteobacteria bacterium]